MSFGASYLLSEVGMRNIEAATPTQTDIEILERLSSNPRNEVWIISGRDSAFLGKHFGCLGSLGLSAEHGAFVRRPNDTEWRDTSNMADRTWQDGIMAIFEDYSTRIQGSMIERKNIAITWHYRNALPEIGLLHSKECKTSVEEFIRQIPPDLEITDGKMCLEVRPKSVNKGAIVRSILDSCTNDRVGPDFVLCAGDDVTDEDMFKAVRNSSFHPEQAFTVSVGPSSKPTTASWFLPEPTDIMALLGKLALVSEKVDSQG
ncbi:MAG: hypothetical protein Q9213_004874 [Squamulea squamosa]